MQGRDPVDMLTSFGQWALSAIGGALVVLVAFRTRLALMDRKHIELEQKVMDRLEQIDRRQSMLLEIVADVARKVGADARFSDAVVRFLAEESRPRRRSTDDASGRDD